MSRCILFDFDGTIADTGPGVMYCARRALAFAGVPIPDDETMRLVVGPPLKVSFARFGMMPHMIEPAIEEFRRIYKEENGKDQVDAYPGMGELLAQLQQAGYRLFVATSKPEGQAVEILERLHFLPYFEKVCGATLDGTRDEKAKVIAYLLSTLEGAQSILMVGDTAFDVLGAAEHGIPTVGVAWGYGDRQEMLSAGALAVARDMDDLRQEIEAAWGRTR